MGYEIGISKCKEALEILLSNELLDKRVDDAFSIIVELNPGDTPIAYYKEIVEWCEKYSLIKGLHIHLDGMLNKTNEENELVKLFYKLTDLCTNIIKRSRKK
jgi:hypothetical protein